MANMLQEMEKDLDNLKKKNVHESIIKLREKQIEQIINTVNTADDIIGVFMVQIKSMILQLHLSESLVVDAISRFGDPREDDNKMKNYFSNDHTMNLLKEVVWEIKRARE
jgi:hypothetical protein